MNQIQKDRAREISEQFQERGEYLHKAYSPSWNARADVAKTLTSLSSAAIVLSVTFSSTLISLNANPAWRYAVVFSFTMLLFSLLSALASLWAGIELHEIQPKIFDEIPEIHNATQKVDPSAADVMQPFEEIMRRVNRPIEIKDKWACRFSRISFVCFGLAFVSLGVVGFRQLLP